MADRTAEHVREEIAAERQGLNEDVDGLKAAIRARVPYLIGGLATLVLAAVGLVLAIKRIRKLF